MANATHEGPPGAERPGEAPVVQKAEVREFKFANDQEPYGFVNIGARVCHVIPGTLAGGLGVQPGWYIALIDGEKLYGATINLRRTIPAVTTEEVVCVFALFVSAWRMPLTRARLVQRGPVRHQLYRKQRCVNSNSRMTRNRTAL
mmetsp:Transcript_160082/g.282259  ORF Transcript_160082/g.282259 Transcript_160082/m.282259 type:complete len:145 (+) Transcript_160082:199-633(+)